MGQGFACVLAVNLVGFLIVVVEGRRVDSRARHFCFVCFFLIFPFFMKPSHLARCTLIRSFPWTLNESKP